MSLPRKENAQRELGVDTAKEIKLNSENTAPVPASQVKRFATAQAALEAFAKQVRAI